MTQKKLREHVVVIDWNKGVIGCSTNKMQNHSAAIVWSMGLIDCSSNKKEFFIQVQLIQIRVQLITTQIKNKYVSGVIDWTWRKF